MTTKTQTTIATLPTGGWRIDPATTKVTVTAKKMGLFNIGAELNVTKGTIAIPTDANSRGLSVDVEVDAGSYNSGNKKRDIHIASADFLDAESHPSLSFTANSVTDTPAGTRLAGDIRVKGKVSPIEFLVSDIDINGTTASFTASAEVDRTALGVDKLPAFVIGRTLQVSIAAKAVQAA